MPDQMREALEAAYDKHAAETPEETQVIETAAPEAPVEKIESSAAEAPTPPVNDGGEKSPPTAAAPPVTPKPNDNIAPVIVQPAAKPPRSWSAEAKAAFAALPEPVKQDVLRREKEISTGLQSAAERTRATEPIRQHYERFNEVVKPFQPMFDAYGVSDPLPLVQELLQYRAVLEVGTPQQKGAAIARIMHDRGVSVDDINAHLAKLGPINPVPPRPYAPRPDYRSDPELAELFELRDRFKQAQLEKAEAQVAEVEVLPHFAELREDIADVMEAFHSVGKKITLEGAYKRALAMNPDLEPAPAAVPQITKSQAAAILASRNAASSISGTPRTGAKPAPTDRREQIAAAWEASRAS